MKEWGINCRVGSLVLKTSWERLKNPRFADLKQTTALNTAWLNHLINIKGELKLTVNLHLNVKQRYNISFTLELIFEGLVEK